jgi:hypothetical protein
VAVAYCTPQWNSGTCSSPFTNTFTPDFMRCDGNVKSEAFFAFLTRHENTVLYFVLAYMIYALEILIVDV